MPKIAILTDSTANLPLEWVQKNEIGVIPIKILWENESFLDGIDITSEEFYDRLSHTRSLPTTSQPSIQDFLQAFESLAEGSDGIVVPLISSGISGTVASAQAAARQFSRVPVEIVDTRVTSTGQAMVVLAAAHAAMQGKSLQDVRRAADNVVERMHLLFAVDTLEYLHRGGRIGGATRYLGTALNLKPILYFDSNGRLDALERVRTKAKSLQRLISLAEEQANGHPIHLGIIHANALQVAQEFHEQITHHLECKEVFTLELSPAIGVHVGPGTIGISFFTEN
ncbi:MAG: DegV family protein [Anaerolineaceae bacterium]